MTVLLAKDYWVIAAVLVIKLLLCKGTKEIIGFHYYSFDLCDCFLLLHWGLVSGRVCVRSKVIETKYFKH